MAGEKLIPPIPYKVPVIDERTGLISQQWGKFIRQLFLRAGGVDALSNLELENANTSTDSQTTTNTTNISTLRDDVDLILKGPLP